MVAFIACCSSFSAYTSVIAGLWWPRPQGPFGHDAGSFEAEFLSQLGGCIVAELVRVPAMGLAPGSQLSLLCLREALAPLGERLAVQPGGRLGCREGAVAGAADTGASCLPRRGACGAGHLPVAAAPCFHPAGAKPRPGTACSRLRPRLAGVGFEPTTSGL
jgi:hypothetical protein